MSYSDSYYKLGVYTEEREDTDDQEHQELFSDTLTQEDFDEEEGIDQLPL